MLVSRIYSSNLAVMGDVNGLVTLKRPKRRLNRQCPKCGGQFRKLKLYNLNPAWISRVPSPRSQWKCAQRLANNMGTALRQE